MNIESETNGFYNSPIAKEIVEVIRRYPEHVEKGYQKACSIDKTSNLRICCYNLGSISLRVELSKLIYTEGETLLVNLRLSNNSKLKVRQIDIALVQHSVFKSKTLREDILKARTSLLVHHMSLDNFGYGEINNKIALNLPDEMQTSTMPYILPPTSFMSFHFSNDADTNAARGNPSTKGNPNTKGSPKLKKIETGNDGEDTTFLVLDANYHTLYDIAYYLHIRVRTSIDWFNMKGPEIRFPITIEGRHKAKNSNDAQTEGEKEANDGEKEANADESTKPEDVGVEVADEPEEINSPAS